MLQRAEEKEREAEDTVQRRTQRYKDDRQAREEEAEDIKELLEKGCQYDSRRQHKSTGGGRLSDGALKLAQAAITSEEQLRAMSCKRKAPPFCALRLTCALSCPSACLCAVADMRQLGLNIVDRMVLDLIRL